MRRGSARAVEPVGRSLADLGLFDSGPLWRAAARTRETWSSSSPDRADGNELPAETLLQQLSDLGCEIALDDFGTGYAGFAYLKRLPVDYLKIDIEFIRDIATNDASRHVVEAVVSLARGFGQKTVAEGIEDSRTIALLTEMHADFGQGFALGRPVPVDQAFFTRA